MRRRLAAEDGRAGVVSGAVKLDMEPDVRALRLAVLAVTEAADLVIHHPYDTLYCDGARCTPECVEYNRRLAWAYGHGHPDGCGCEICVFGAAMTEAYAFDNALRGRT